MEANSFWRKYLSPMAQNVDRRGFYSQRPSFGRLYLAPVFPPLYVVDRGGRGCRREEYFFLPSYCERVVVVFPYFRPLRFGLF